MCSYHVIFCRLAVYVGLGVCSTSVCMFFALRKKKTNQLDLILSEMVTWKDDPISDLLRQLAENRRKLPGPISLTIRLLKSPYLQTNDEETLF